MRYLVVGDIHGCYSALRALAEYVPFRHEDCIVTLGDYVNRGPNSAAVLDWLIAYRTRAQLIALRGNHEIMMLAARENEQAFQQWIECGGDATLKSYSPFDDAGRLVDIPDDHWSFIENDTVSYFENDTHIFVHAGVYPELPLNEQPDFMLYWEAFDLPAPHESGKTVVSGHTSQRTGVPLSIEHAVCIDTWAWGSGWLTCLDLLSGKYWQANNSGQTRWAWLE